MSSFRDALGFPRLRELYDYWHRVRGARDVPLRSDIDPLDMRGVLGHVVLFDVERDPIRFRYRLVGTELARVRGVDLTGRYIDEVSIFSAHDAIIRFYTRVVTEPCIGLQRGPDTLFDARVGCMFRLSLPMSSDGRAIDMILGGFEYRPTQDDCAYMEIYEPLSPPRGN
ncbi:MAG TPA: PAS domain-containing protein [Alphaproteobacteria bacterium]